MFKYLISFLLGCFGINEFKSSLYILIRYMTWKYSLLLCALSFASLMVSFETEVFTSDEMQFIYSFAICTFSIICKKKLFILRS